MRACAGAQLCPRRPPGPRVLRGPGEGEVARLWVEATGCRAGEEARSRPPRART